MEAAGTEELRTALVEPTKPREPGKFFPARRSQAKKNRTFVVAMLKIAALTAPNNNIYQLKI